MGRCGTANSSCACFFSRISQGGAGDQSMWWCIANILSNESSYGYTCTIQPKIEGRKRPPAASQASCVAIEPFNPNFDQSAFRSCARGGMQRLVCKCHIATLNGT